jgi:hypothetical protein
VRRSQVTVAAGVVIPANLRLGIAKRRCRELQGGLGEGFDALGGCENDWSMGLIEEASMAAWWPRCSRGRGSTWLL